MKRIIILVILVALLVQPALALIPVAQAQGPDGEGEPASGGMPGYPAPAKPIPHHEPGQPSRAGSYRTQVVRENELGVMEEVQLSGVDAMVADGLDPLVGNYSLVNWDQILLSWHNAASDILDWQSLKYDDEQFLEDSERAVMAGDYYYDITAADINGDGQAEKIIVYIFQPPGLPPLFRKLIIETSEMKGYQRATSAPAAVAHSDDQIDLVVRGYDDALWHHDGSTWNNQSATNSPALLSGPATAARGAGAFDVFVIGPDNQIYRGSFDGSTWSSWILIDGQGIWPALDAWCGPTPELPAPAVVARGNKLDLFRLGPDNTLRWLHSEDGSTWGAWQNLGGMISTGLGVVSQNEDHMRVYARGVDESLWYLTYDNGGWGSWQRVTETMDGGVTIASAPAVLSPDEIYVRGSDNHLWRYDGSGWTDLGGELASGVAVTTGSPKLFALKHDGSLQSDDGTGWSDFGRIPYYGSHQYFLLSDIIPRTPDQSWQEPENIWVDVETGNFLGNCRRQVAVAVQQLSDGSGIIAVYEIGVGFVPVQIAALDPVQYISDAEYPPRITAADVDGDGTDEIAVVYVKKEDHPSNELPGRFYMLDIFDIKYEGGRWKLESLLEEPYQYDGIIEADFVDSGFAGTLQIASGDINGDGTDEVAIISDWVDYNGDGTVDDYWIRFRIIYYDPGSVPASVQTYEEPFHADFVSGFPGDYSETFLTGVALAAGDVDGDTKDEFVRTWPADCNLNGYTFGGWPVMERGLDVIQGTETTEPDVESTCAMLGGIDYTYLDRLAVGDVDLDLVDEVVLYGYRADKDPEGPYLEVFNYQESEPYLVPEGFREWPYWIPWESVSKTGLALGPLSGESIRVGRPTYRVQNRVDSVLAVLNMPPKHWDIIKKDDGTYQTIQILTEECWASPTDPQCTHALYGSATTTERSAEITRKKELALSIGSEWRMAVGFLAEGSIESTYGTDFEDTYGEHYKTGVTQEITADIDDQIVYYGTAFDIWEYPVFSDAQTTTPDGYITVMFPKEYTTSNEKSQIGGQCAEGWYAPRHQRFNVWSYDSVGQDPPDFEEENLIFQQQNGGNHWFEVTQEYWTEAVTTRSQQHSFTSDIGFGMESSGSIGISTELSAEPLGIGASVEVSVSTNWETRYKAYVKNDFNTEEIQTDQLKTTDNTYISAYMAGQSATDNYTTKAIVYRATGGPLVLDWQTDPGEGETWSWYDKPDPAFILPWYGFPDPDNLPYPDPNNQGGPPCGHEKQLFSHDIVIVPPIASVGETVTISATVHNFSDEPVNNVVVRFYQGHPDNGGVEIGTAQTISTLSRSGGPRTVSTTWNAAGEARQKIYAVIDPDNQIEEMHDENHATINNNMAYRPFQLGGAAYVDPGTPAEVPYATIGYWQGSNKDLPFLTLYVPPANLDATTRLDLREVKLNGVQAVGKPFELVAFQGSDDQSWGKPIENFDLTPEPDDPPAVIGLAYSNADIAGRNEADLKLYRLWGSYGMEATCPGYQIHRFPADNLLLVPICQGGIFAFLDTAPELPPIYLPLIFKGSP